VQDIGVRSLAGLVEDAVSDAISRRLPERRGADPLVRRSDRADFQSNAALAMGKAPRDVATSLATALRAGGLGAEVSGPGFVNVTLPGDLLWRQVTERSASPRLGVGTPQSGRRTVVDYSGLNVAKEAHVGHLRTTVIGDCLARVLAFLGADVIRQNHLGDWGTQFGMLIQYLDEHPGRREPVDELYRAARKQFDADPEFAGRSRRRVVALQSGDPATLARWRDIVAESERAFQRLYDRLGVLLTPADSAGESRYNAQLSTVVDELTAAGIAVESDGALCVFVGDVPLMLRKSDGGYGYDTTDLATIRYRIRELAADRILYVVDARQALHFRMVFEAARRAGWLTDDVDVEHVAFGSVLGPDGKPFKTRAGDTVRLSDLLDAAVARARSVVAEKHDGGTDLDAIAEQAGIGAVKYADLSTSRVKDYVFDVDRMVSFTGNTGVYLQYAHTRVSSILRKAGAVPSTVDTTVPLRPQERALVLALDGFADTVVEVGDTLEPHRLCGYLFGLAKAFTDFFETCPVLAAETPAVRGNRLALCRLTRLTLHKGLDLLGIAAPERM
jgi:arginyl-tRNA synthetase